MERTPRVLAVSTFLLFRSLGDVYHHKLLYDIILGTIYNNLDLSNLNVEIINALLVLGGKQGRSPQCVLCVYAQNSTLYYILIYLAWIGSLLGATPSGIYGRRFTLLGNTANFILGGALSASGNVYCLYVGKFVSGFGVGIVSVVAPVLLSEISSDETRGTITTMHQVIAY